MRRLFNGHDQEQPTVAEKMSRKELKQPDALQRAGLDASSWLEGKQKLIVAGVAGIVALGLVIAIGTEISRRSQRQAQRQLGAAIEPVARPVAEPGAAATPDDLGRTPFESQKAKDEAVVESLTRFRTEHSGSRAAATAALPLAQSLYRLGKHEEAARGYDDFLAQASGSDPLRAVALEGKGYALEAKGELDRAFQAFDELSKLGTTEFLNGMGQLHMGRMLILQGKPEEAARVLSELRAKLPNSAAARQATERLNLLASQGIAVPQQDPGTGGAAGEAQGN